MSWWTCRRLVRVAAALAVFAMAWVPVTTSDEFHTLTGDFVAHGDGLGPLYSAPTTPQPNSTEISRIMAGSSVALTSDSVWVYGTRALRNETDGSTAGFPALFALQLNKSSVAVQTSYNEFDGSDGFGGEYLMFFQNVKAAVYDGAAYVLAQGFDFGGANAVIIRASLDLQTVFWYTQLNKYVADFNFAPVVMGIGGIAVNSKLIAVTGNLYSDVGAGAFVLGLEPITGELLWREDISSPLNEEGQKDTDIATAVAFYETNDEVVFTGTSYGDMDGPGFAVGNRYEADTYGVVVAQTTGAIIRRYMFGVTASNTVYGLYVDESEGVMYQGGSMEMLLTRQSAIASVRSAAGSKDNAVVRLNFGHKTDSGSLFHRYFATYGLKGKMIAAGQSAAKMVPGAKNRNNPTSAMYLMNDKMEFMWFRFLDMEGQSGLLDMKCDSEACYGAGFYKPLESNSTYYHVMRTPLCGNGMRLPNDTNWAANQLTEYNYCYKCGAGMYQDEVLETTCKSCSPGSYAPTAGLANCLPCPAGYYTSRNESTYCDICPPGTFSTAGSTMCTGCSAGSYSANAGSGECTPCAAGSASAVPNATLASVCETCSIGHYQPSVGQSSCLECPGGSYSNTTGATECALCEPGQYLNATAATSIADCTMCPAGTYAASGGKAVCDACPLGRYQNTTGATSCHPCPATTQGNATGLTVCYPCPPGSFGVLEGLEKCSSCAEGTFQDLSGQTSCHNCAKDTFMPFTGGTQCFSCPDFSSTQESEATDTMFGCKCIDNYFGKPGEGRKCQPCPAFASCQPDDRYPRMDPGSWQSSDDTNTIYYCQPRISCPGGIPDLPEVNITNAVTRPEDVQLRWTDLEPIRAMEATRQADARMRALSTTTYTSACTLGYTGVACSTCDTNYYRSKGECVSCGGTEPFEGADAVIYVFWVLFAVVVMVGILACGVWQGSATVVIERQKKRLVEMMSMADQREDPDCTAEDIRILALHGVVQREVDLDAALVDTDAGLRLERGEMASVSDIISLPSLSHAGSSFQGPQVEEPEPPKSAKPAMALAKSAVMCPWRAWKAVLAAKNVVSAFLVDNFGPSQPVTDRVDMEDKENRGLKSRVASVLAKLIKFGQLSSVVLNIKVEWPDALVSLADALQVASFETNDVITVQCLTGSTASEAYRSRYFGRILLPLSIMAPSLSYAIVSSLMSSCLMCVIRRRARRARAKDKDAEVQKDGVLVFAYSCLKHSTDAFVHVFMLMAVYAFITFHAAVVELFSCTERVNNTYFISTEPAIQCFVVDGVWIELVPISIVGFILLSLGTPMLLIFVIFSRHRLRDDPVINTRYGFLWNAYRDDKFWYELVVVLFKFVVVMMLPLSFFSAGDQLCAMLFVVILFYLIHLNTLPYVVPSDNMMEALLLGTVLLLDITGIILYTNEDAGDGEGISDFGKNLLGVIVVMFVCFVILYFLYVLAGGPYWILRLSRAARGLRSNAKANMGAFWRAAHEGDYEAVRPSTMTTLKDAKPSTMANTALRLPANTYILGIMGRGRTMYVPRSYTRHLTQAIDLCQSHNVTMAPEGSVASTALEVPEMTIAGGKDSGKDMLAAFLLIGLAERSPTTDQTLSGAPVIYYQTDAVVFRMHAEDGSFKSMTYQKYEKMQLRLKARDRAPEKAVMVTRSDALNRVASPAGCVLRIHIVSLPQLQASHTECLAEGSAGLHHCTVMTAWSLKDKLAWAQFQAGERDDEADYLKVLHQHMAVGGSMACEGQSTRKLNDIVVTAVDSLHIGEEQSVLSAAHMSSAEFLQRITALGGLAVGFEESGASQQVTLVLVSQKALEVAVDKYSRNVSFALTDIDHLAELSMSTPHAVVTPLGVVRQLLHGITNALAMSGDLSMMSWPHASELGQDSKLYKSKSLFRSHRAWERKCDCISLRGYERGLVTIDKEGLGQDVWPDVYYQVHDRRFPTPGTSLVCVNVAVMDAVIGFAWVYEANTLRIFKLAHDTAAPPKSSVVHRQTKAIVTAVITAALAPHARHKATPGILTKLVSSIFRTKSHDGMSSDEEMPDVQSKRRIPSSPASTSSRSLRRLFSKRSNSMSSDEEMPDVQSKGTIQSSPASTSSRSMRRLFSKRSNSPPMSPASPVRMTPAKGLPTVEMVHITSAGVKPQVAGGLVTGFDHVTVTVQGTQHVVHIGHRIAVLECPVV